MKFLDENHLPEGSTSVDALDKIALMRAEMRAEKESGFIDTIITVYAAVVNVFNIVKVCLYFRQAYEWFNNIDGDRRQTGAVKTLIRQAEGVLSKRHFTDIEDLLVPCPDGFRGNFPAYVEILKQQYAECSVLALETLKVMESATKSYNSDRVFRRQKMALPPAFIGLRKKVEVWTKDSSAFVKGVNQRQRLGAMFETKAEISSTLYNAVQSQEKTFDLEPKDFKSRSEKVVSLLDEASKIFNKSTDQDKREYKECTITLAEMAMLCAHCTEYLATLYMRIETASVTAGNISQSILKLDGK